MTAARGGASATAQDAGARERERELVLRVRQGETEAFDLLVRDYVGRARAIARRLMRDPHDADDLVQDAFLRALERIEAVDPERPFGPWFFRLLVNTGLDTLRRRRVRRTEPERPEIAAAGPSPLQDLERDEIRRRFEAALDALPPRQRLIIWAHEVDGASTEEIAETIGVSRVTVRWHLHQGRKVLREALADLRR